MVCIVRCEFFWIVGVVLVLVVLLRLVVVDEMWLSGIGWLVFWLFDGVIDCYMYVYDDWFLVVLGMMLCLLNVIVV